MCTPDSCLCPRAWGIFGSKPAPHCRTSVLDLHHFPKGIFTSNLVLESEWEFLPNSFAELLTQAVQNVAALCTAFDMCGWLR